MEIFPEIVGGGGGAANHFDTVMQGSAKGAACPFHGNGAFGSGNGGLWKKLQLFRIYGSPDATDIVTVSPREITAQAGRV